MEEPSSSLEASTANGTELVPGFALSKMMEGVKNEKVKRGSTVMVDLPNMEDVSNGGAEDLVELSAVGEGVAELPSLPVTEDQSSSSERNLESSNSWRQEKERQEKEKPKQEEKKEARASGWSRLRSKTTGPLGIRSQWLETIKLSKLKKAQEDVEREIGGEYSDGAGSFDAGYEGGSSLGSNSSGKGGKARESIQVGKSKTMWREASRNLKEAQSGGSADGDPRRLENLKAQANAAKMVYDEVMARDAGGTNLYDGRPNQSTRRSSLSNSEHGPSRPKQAANLRHSTSLDGDLNGDKEFGADSKVGVGLLSKLRATRTRIASRAGGLDEADTIRRTLAKQQAARAKDLARAQSGRGGKKNSLFFRSNSEKKQQGPKVRRQTMAQIRKLNNNSDAASQLAGLKR
jgi:hypothetical protein